MDDTMIDSEARERVSALEMAVWGPQGTNGLKSEVRNLNQTVAQIQTELRHYVDTRPETCLGLKALAEHEQEEGQLYDESREEEKEMTIAEGANKTKLSEARLTLAGIVLVAAMSLVGQIITANQASATQRDIAALSATLKAQK